jgi:hypothetical protein
LNTYPYTLSTKEGNCTFVDQSQEKNTDSHYGANDHAFNCNPTYESVIYDQLYTIVSSVCRGVLNPVLTLTGRLSPRLPLLR